MTDIELSGIQLPNGQTLVYTTEPGVVLQDLSTQPYGSSGVVDMAWMKAAHIVGRQYTDREIKNGWPLEIEPHRLACLQFPEGGNDQSNLNTMLIAYCERGRLKCRAFIRDDYALLLGGCRELIETWTDYSITAPVFAAWLTAQGMEPSPHVAAWFKALGISTQAVPAPAQNAATPAPVLNGASNAPVVPFKKAALVAAHVHEWPTIESDISDAAKNGLAATAKAGTRGWREDAALIWARANGKLISAAKPADSLAQAMHTLSTLPSRKHTMQG